MLNTPKFIYNFFRFTGDDEDRRTEFVRDYRIADGIRSLVDQKEEAIRHAIGKVISWAASVSGYYTPRTTPLISDGRRSETTWVLSPCIDYFKDTDNINFPFWLTFTQYAYPGSMVWISK